MRGLSKTEKTFLVITMAVMILLAFGLIGCSVEQTDRTQYGASGIELPHSGLSCDDLAKTMILEGSILNYVAGSNPTCDAVLITTRRRVLVDICLKYNGQNCGSI